MRLEEFLKWVRRFIPKSNSTRKHYDEDIFCTFKGMAKGHFVLCFNRIVMSSWSELETHAASLTTGRRLLYKEFPNVCSEYTTSLYHIPFGKLTSDEISHEEEISLDFSSDAMPSSLHEGVVQPAVLAANSNQTSRKDVSFIAFPDGVYKVIMLSSNILNKVSDQPHYKIGEYVKQVSSKVFDDEEYEAARVHSTVAGGGTPDPETCYKIVYSEEREDINARIMDATFSFNIGLVRVKLKEDGAKEENLPYPVIMGHSMIK